METIPYDVFSRLDIRIGTILAAERVPETDKLVKLSVAIGEDSPRTLVAGIAAFIPDVSFLVGRQIPILANLLPRTLKGIESQGMILAASDDEGGFSLLSPHMPIKNGARVK